MAEWPNQISEFQHQWAQQQRQLMNDWLKTLQSGGGVTLPNTLREVIDVIEQQVNSALDAQKRSLIELVENAERVEGVPEPFTQGLHQLEEGIETWNDMQQRLWQVWFDTLRTTALVPQTPGETLVKNLQDMAQRAISIQEQWLSSWTDLQTATSGSTGNKYPELPASRQSSRTTDENTNKGKD